MPGVKPFESVVTEVPLAGHGLRLFQPFPAGVKAVAAVRTCQRGTPEVVHWHCPATYCTISTS